MPHLWFYFTFFFYNTEFGQKLKLAGKLKFETRAPTKHYNLREVGDMWIRPVCNPKEWNIKLYHSKPLTQVCKISKTIETNIYSQTISKEKTRST